MESAEIEKILKENTELLKDHHSLLKKIHRHMLVNRIFRSIYWVAIISVAFGSYYLFQPYIDRLGDAYSSITNGIQGVGDFISNDDEEIPK